VNASPVIIASGGANLASLKFALQRLGTDAAVTEDVEEIRRATHVLLPGVGAARDAMERLQSTGLASAISDLSQPVLGICLGMQLLFTGSDEDTADCLGIIPGQAVQFHATDARRVPQMGWNELKIESASTLLTGVRDGGYAYFIHSYALPVGEFTLATADYGAPFSAIVQKDNFFGTQFHPERSAALGAQLLTNFLEL
jgi:imidazole glycerol-phosphate synthase subunit HisH